MSAGAADVGGAPDGGRPDVIMELLEDSSGGVGEAVSFAFSAIGVAEERIDRAKARHPEAADLLDRAFVALRPRSALFRRPVHDRVLEAHMDEILLRVVEEGEAADLTRATYAEACLVLSRLTEMAPLSETWRTAYVVTFMETFGEDEAERVLGWKLLHRADEDRRDRAVLDVLDEVRRRASDPDRALRDPRG